jgi:hypothetical protein
LAHADAAVEEAESRAVRAAKSWQATQRCIAKAKAALRRDMEERQPNGENPRRLPLLLNGTAEDLRLSFEQCTDYDLWTRICEDSEVHPSLDPTNAALRRAARLDRVLAQAGCEAGVFTTLTEEERVAVGNMYARWLRTKLGPVDHAALVRGERTLRDLGLVRESDTVLAPIRARMAPLRPSLVPQSPLTLSAGEQAPVRAEA